MSKKPIYDESSIQSLDWKEHIRERPGMYIGKLGNGKSSDDGIYVLLKEVIDNSIDEYIMGYGKKINVKMSNMNMKIIINKSNKIKITRDSILLDKSNISKYILPTFTKKIFNSVLL